MNIDGNGKLKKALIIGIPIVVVVVIVGAGILVYKTAKAGDKALQTSHVVKSISTNSNNSSGNSNNNSKIVKTDTDKTDNKVNDTKKQQEINDNQLKGNPNVVKNAPNINAASASISANATGFEKIFYNTFGQQIQFPVIVNNKEDNIVKIYATYVLGYLKCMKNLGDETLQGKYSKSNYYTSLETTSSSLKTLINPLKQIVSQTNSSASTNAENLLNIVELEATRANSEYMFIKGSSSFGDGMITSLAFGSSLDDAINQVQEISNSLGCDNSQALTDWQQSYKMLLPVF